MKQEGSIEVLGPQGTLNRFGFEECPDMAMTWDYRGTHMEPSDLSSQSTHGVESSSVPLACSCSSKRATSVDIQEEDCELGDKQRSCHSPGH